MVWTLIIFFEAPLSIEISRAWKKSSPSLSIPPERSWLATVEKEFFQTGKKQSAVESGGKREPEKLRVLRLSYRVLVNDIEIFVGNEKAIGIQPKLISARAWKNQGRNIDTKVMNF